MGCRHDYVAITTGLPQIAADLPQRPGRQRRAIAGLMQCSKPAGYVHAWTIYQSYDFVCANNFLSNTLISTQIHVPVDQKKRGPLAPAPLLPGCTKFSKHRTLPNAAVFHLFTHGHSDKFLGCEFSQGIFNSLPLGC